jgi:hypothetical protein
MDRIGDNEPAGVVDRDVRWPLQRAVTSVAGFQVESKLGRAALLLLA